MHRGTQASLNAIQQSSEFIELGKKESALEVLFEAIRARRGKTWSPSVEEAMKNFLNLCLSTRNAHVLKEGANQYRILCQITNVSSFENVFTKFFDDCLEASDKARSQSRGQVLAEDLDEIETPETILLKSISETTQQDRTDRILLSPTLKFVWEAFRNTLEISKNNRNLEKVYLEIGKRVFKFLDKFSRKTEFRKLCEVTRMHLQQTYRYTQNTLSVNLNDTSSIDLQLEMRLCQLETAISLELWNEAFKTMEDIHFILRLTKKTPHPKILAIFYQKISLVFSRANVPHFHAVALQKLFILVKEHKKGFRPEELRRISSRVLAATISIPLSMEQSPLNSMFLRFNENLPTMMQLSSILGLCNIPRRSSIIEEMVGMCITQYADQTMVNIFNILQNARQICNVCKTVFENLSKIPQDLTEELFPYMDSIKKIAFCVCFISLSKIYETISLSSLENLSCYYDREMTLKIILECRNHNLVSFTFDGSTNYIRFHKNPLSICHQLQNLHSDLIISTASRLHDLFSSVSKYERGALSIEFLEAHRQLSMEKHNHYRGIQEDVAKYLEKVSKENEEFSKQLMVKMEEERTRIEVVQKQRLEEDRKKRDEKRLLQEYNEKQILETLVHVNELRDIETAKKIIRDIKDGNLEKIPSKFLAVQNELRDKEVSQHVKKIKKLEKSCDLLFIVSRSFEKNRIHNYMEALPEKHLNTWNKRDIERLKALEQMKKLQGEIRNRLLTATDDIEEFKKSSHQKALQTHQQLLTEFHEMLDKERELVKAKKLKEYIQKAKEKYVSELKAKSMSPKTVDRPKPSNESGSVKPARFQPKQRSINAFSSKPSSSTTGSRFPSSKRNFSTDYGLGRK